MNRASQESDMRQTGYCQDVFATADWHGKRLDYLNANVQRCKFPVYRQRLEAIEEQLSDPKRYITREQVSRISQAVKAIGLFLTKQSGTTEYGRIYGELYRRYDISAYRELPASKYEDAMKWLNEWYQSLTSDTEF